jgi:hypothetical protein
MSDNAALVAKTITDAYTSALSPRKLPLRRNGLMVVRFFKRTMARFTFILCPTQTPTQERILLRQRTQGQLSIFLPTLLRPLL